MENVSGVLVRFKDQIFSYMNVPGVQIGLVDVVEILIISMLFYKVLIWIKTTGFVLMMRGFWFIPMGSIWRVAGRWEPSATA